MKTLIIDDERLAARLNELAQTEQKPLSDLLWQMFRQYIAVESETMASRLAARKAMAGMFDDDIDDLSETVDETIMAYYRRKFSDAD